MRYWSSPLAPGPTQGQSNPSATPSPTGTASATATAAATPSAQAAPGIDNETAVRMVLPMVVFGAVALVLMCVTLLVGGFDDHPQPASASIVAMAAALLHLPSMC